VRERERRAPRAAEHEPAFDPQVLPEAFDVVDQMARGVAGEVGGDVGGGVNAPSAAALVEQHDPIGGRIEVAPEPGRAPGAGAAVEDDRRLPVRRPARLPVHELSVAHVEHPAVERLDLRIALAHDRYGFGLATIRNRMTATITSRIAPTTWPRAASRRNSGASGPSASSTRICRRRVGVYTPNPSTARIPHSTSAD